MNLPPEAEPEAEPWDGLPDSLKREMMLEMLVDDELPEAQRSRLLGSLDTMPQQWRTLALRLLEHQAEHTSVKEFISRASVAPEAPSYKFPVKRTWPVQRVAAGLILLAGVSAVVIIARNQPPQTQPIASSNETVQLDGTLMGSFNQASVPVDLVRTQDMPNSLLQGRSMTSNSSRTVFIVPQGPDRAAIIPVTSAKAEIIY